MVRGKKEVERVRRMEGERWERGERVVVGEGEEGIGGVRR